MPKLIRLYIRSVVIGFGVAAVFAACLIGLDVAGVGRLILNSDIGWIAAGMLVVFNGIVFSGVQFAIALVPAREEGRGPGDGHGPDRPARVKVMGRHRRR